jgi:hypothetical protein
MTQKSDSALNDTKNCFASEAPSLCHSEPLRRRIPVFSPDFRVRLWFSTQVSPPWILFFDQRKLFRSRYALKLFFSGNRRVCVVRLLKINQLIDSVALRETIKCTALVLIHAPFEIIRHADVERLRWTTHYIDVVALAARRFSHTASGSGILRSALNDTKTGILRCALNDTKIRLRSE